MVDLLQALGIHRADVAGWSMGGWVALKLTADHPALVERLVVLDSAGVYFPPTFDASLFTPTDAAGLTRLTAFLTPHPRPIPAFIARDAIRHLQANSWVIARSLASMEDGRDLMDFRLGKIVQPTLIVWGGEDRLIPPSVGKLMQARIPNSSLLIIEGCGHLAPSECATPILRGTASFLKTTSPPPPREPNVPTHAP